MLSLSVQSLSSAPSAKPTLDPLLHLIQEDLKEVNQVILHHLESSVGLIPQLASYMINAGGKRIRPLLTLATAKLCGYEGSEHITLAACVEFIHSATLLHDDVVDESALRRGQSAAHEIWGNQASVLVGDFLFSRAFQLMVKVGSLDVLSILSHASVAIAEGEVMQLTTTQDLLTTKKQYLEIIASKTATLFEAACEVGAVLAGAPLECRQALAKFGHGIGIAFQLVDDALDYSARESKFGKNIGDDFKEGKITLPLVLAFEKATEDEKLFWRRTLTHLDQQEGDLDQAISYMNHHKTIEETLKQACLYTQDVKKELDIFAPSPLKKALEELADFVTFRAL